MNGDHYIYYDYVGEILPTTNGNNKHDQYAVAVVGDECIVVYTYHKDQLAFKGDGAGQAGPVLARSLSQGTFDILRKNNYVVYGYNVATI